MSAAIVIAYVMSVTRSGFSDTLTALKSIRPQVDLNFGFQNQLKLFESDNLNQVFISSASKQALSNCGRMKRSGCIVI